MGQITIGMLSSYPSLNPPPGDWLWQQTPHPFGVWGKIQMLSQTPKPDFLLLYQFNFRQPSPKLSWRDRLLGRQPSPPLDIHSLLRGVPQDKIIYLLREPPLDEVVEKHKASYGVAKKYCGYVSGPEDFAPTPNYMPAIWYLSNSFRELNEMPSPPKEKRCSWITSGIDRTANHRQRLAFLKLVQSQELDVDFYGKDLPTWVKSGGQVDNKAHGMMPYYYNLAIENYAGNDWYVSEKLWDSLLSWCLPIYYGGSAADRLLPPGCFLRLPSLDEKGLAYIQEVTATLDAWHEAKAAIAEARQIILHKLNLLNWLSDFVG